MEPTFGLGQSNDAYAKYFSGKSFLNMLTDAEKTSLVAYNVTFEPEFSTGSPVGDSGGARLFAKAKRLRRASLQKIQNIILDFYSAPTTSEPCGFAPHA